MRLTPVHVQQTQPEFLLITAVAAGQSESEMVSIYIYHTTVQDSQKNNSRQFRFRIVYTLALVVVNWSAD